MATAQDVLNAISAHEAAVTAKENAVNALDAVQAAVEAEIANEITTYNAALAAFNAAQNTARQNHGFQAAVDTLNQATTDEEAARFIMRDVTIEFGSAIS